MKKPFDSVDIKRAQEKKIELRNPANYDCDEKRKALGWDDFDYRDHLRSIPPGIRSQVHKAFQGEASPAKAIAAMCYHCVGYSSLKEEISGCRGSRCPLYAYRPYQPDQAEDPADEL